VLTPWTLTALLAIATVDSECPTLPSGSDPRTIAVAIGRAHAARRTAAPHCLPYVDLRLGELLVESGDGRAAVLPLTRAIAARSGERGRAFLALARAQVLAGEPYDALRSLASAQRLLPRASPALAAAIDEATLLVRLWVRRGGTSWGSYRFDVDWSDEPKRRAGKIQRLAARHHTVVALAKRALEPVTGAATSLVLAGKTADCAISPNGTIYVLDREGTVHTSAGRTIVLARDRARKADAIAIGPHDEIWVAADGRVHEFDPAGTHLRTLTTPTDAIDLATDDAGTLHVLRRGGGGVLRVGPGDRLSAIPADTDDWSWRRVTAIAADRAGGSYVLTDDPAAIYVIAPDGASSGRVDPPEIEKSMLRNARDLAVIAPGDIYVLVGDRWVRRYR